MLFPQGTLGFDAIKKIAFICRWPYPQAEPWARYWTPAWRSCVCRWLAASLISSQICWLVDPTFWSVRLILVFRGHGTWARVSRDVMRTSAKSTSRFAVRLQGRAWCFMDCCHFSRFKFRNKPGKVIFILLAKVFSPTFRLNSVTKFYMKNKIFKQLRI